MAGMNRAALGQGGDSSRCVGLPGSIRLPGLPALLVSTIMGSHWLLVVELVTIWEWIEASQMARQMDGAHDT
jgi:hypothetical protein